ncbi:MAG: hypothetical protein NZ954_05650 [Thermofilaceae archaeon]|nr:hypothetical protein [Thermofilaceae archaeon]MDW8004052.1 hypothetical protein [Thermofilaceae archaeon]
MALSKYFNKFVSSHVGSLPLDYTPDGFKRAFHDMLKLGIDVPPLPQLRDFISMYLKPLLEAGLVQESGTVFKSSVEDLGNAARVTPYIEEVALSGDLLREAKVSRIRVPVTGAFTLSSRIYLGDPSRGLRTTALANHELVLDSIASYLSNIVREAVKIQNAVIVIDEPVLGTVIGSRVTLLGYREEDVLEVYAKVLKPARGLLRGTHVCGQVNERLISTLAESEAIDFLNHEFHDAPANLLLPWRKLLERSDKFLSPGVFSTRSGEVESVDHIMNVALKVLDTVGVDRVNLFSGDCGLGGLRGVSRAYDLALSKLNNLVKAVSELNLRYLSSLR